MKTKDKILIINRWVIYFEALTSDYTGKYYGTITLGTNTMTRNTPEYYTPDEVIDHAFLLVYDHIKKVVAWVEEHH